MAASDSVHLLLLTDDPEKHRKMHMETDSEIIVDMLDKVYNDSALTAAQKRAHALEILKKDPSELGKGQGVGD